ncbi:MAG: inositol monophosphatase [Deltaproteobacteria bacterium]|nr:inositol monophosphatase [Deltaproteobacteria bacterium]
MSNAIENEILPTALEAADRASRLAKEIRLSGELQVQLKGELDLVTHADLSANEAIIDTIARKFPDHKFLSEESSNEGSAGLLGPTWIIDPIDGTTNYVHGHMHVGISVAFIDEGKIHVGVVRAPFMNETYVAVRGQGAHCNGNALRASSCRDTKKALVATGFPYTRDSLDTIIERVRKVLMHCRDIRRNGACSLDLCWVASGKLDAYYETVMPWDMAAGSLIAKEAGALVGNLAPQAAGDTIPPELYSRDLLAAAPGIYQAMAALLE